MSSSASVSSSSTVISVDGREKCCAINVGTNAERITTVTSSVNWTGRDQVVRETLQRGD